MYSTSNANIEWHYLYVGKVCIFVWGNLDNPFIVSGNIRNGGSLHPPCRAFICDTTEGRSIGKVAGDGEEIHEVPYRGVCVFGSLNKKVKLHRKYFYVQAMSEVVAARLLGHQMLRYPYSYYLPTSAQLALC
jgi:hypothetical protein